MNIDETRWREIVSDARESSIEILQKMVSFDTEAATYSDPPRDDVAHQEFVADYLRGLGAEVELFEPAAAEFSEHPMAFPGQSFDGRPIVWAELKGGPGPSLLFNGHYDTVPAGPADAWSLDPLSGAIVDGRVYGRGSCDMKGGNAAALAAVGALVRAGVELGGSIFFNLVPFEEHNGMGTTATMLRGYRADAAVCCEPTGMRPLIACHGILGLRLEAEGRSAHGEIPQPHHSLGGGVNAIDKLCLLLEEVRRMHTDWQLDPAKGHAFLSPPTAITGLVKGGEFWASFPSTAEATIDITYQPGEVDADGYGSAVRAEVEQRLRTVASLDGWLANRPPHFDWFIEYPPKDISPDEPIVKAATAAASTVRNEIVEPGGCPSWADQAMLIKEGGIPTVLWGPGGNQAHMTDEFIEINEMHRGVEGYLDLLGRWWA